MIELADTIDICNPNAVDIVGTGGDGSNLFNVSTASALWQRRQVLPLPNTVIVVYQQALALQMC